jgi:hypothetical protein
MVAWPLWPADQYRRILLRPSALVLCFVSALLSHRRNRELARLTNFFSWPLALPVDAATMNWSSVLFFGCILISIIFWFAKGRHVYTGPVAHMRRDL